MSRTLYTFHGGVHPPEHKQESSVRPIIQSALPQQLFVPIRQHMGEPAQPCVAVGERVRKGQVIAKPDGYVSVAVHAPTSGTVTAIAAHPVPHPSGLNDTCIHIQPDGLDEWVERHATDWRDTPPSTLRNILRDMGIAGLGGAVFPTWIKLNPGRAAKVPLLLINGGECEPWITCDDLTMREHADGIVQGAAIMRHLLGAEQVVIAIEDNKPDAISAMRKAATQADYPLEIVGIPTLYPSGGAKQLIKVITGREVPSGGRSTDVGVATFNVGTTLAVHRAIHLGEPMISRVVTVTGNVHTPQNYDVLLGTPMHDLVAWAGGHVDPVSGYIMGGPMMGFDLHTVDAPVVKATNCVLVKSDALFPPAPSAQECIRCTRCADACPAELQPQALYWFARSKHFDKAQDHHLFDCIECGCCGYVCPSHIPLVHYYRYAKSEISAARQAEQAADHARERHETRLARMEREEQERAARLAQRAAAKPANDGGNSSPSDAVQAAMQRARAQQQTPNAE